MKKKINFKNIFIKSKKTNLILIFCTLLLVVIGCIFVYSASSYSASLNYSNKYYFLTKQIIGAVIGILALILTSKLDYRLYEKYKLPILITGVVLLAIVFIPGLGVSNYGAQRWIRLPGFTIQPSEIAKFCFVIFVASYMAKNKDLMKSFKGILPILMIGGVYCVLIMLEPNMSITICVGLTMFIMLFVGGAKIKHFLLLGIPVICLGVLLVVIEPYRMERLVAFINPWANPQGEGYQLIQSLYSLSSGGLFGVGIFNSRQKYLFLPFSESDFIFSIIGEETGFFGCIVLIAIFALLIYQGIKVAFQAKDRFGCYLASGIVSIIGVQVLINIAVVTGSIPPTGVPLPFISAGSTSLVVFMSAIGILINIDKQSRV